MESRAETETDVRMLGWSPLSATRMLGRVAGGGAPEGLPGDFVAVRERIRDGRPEVTIATSLASSPPYYWTHRREGGAIVHGTDLFDVVRRAGLPWRWNDDAVRSLALIRHLTGDETLHRDVRRVPPGAVLEARGGDVAITRHDALLPALADDTGTDEEAMAALLEVLAELPERPLVALTAGLDSRLILAALLHLGRRPVLWTAGPRDSTDARVAERLAWEADLDHHVAELRPADYVRLAGDITRRTGGAYPAGDWHSRLFFAGARDLGCPVVLKGANGELARTFYADAGPASRLADRGPAGLARVRLELMVRRGRAAYGRLPAFLDPARGGDDGADLPDRLAALCGGPARPLDRLDHFYACQRVPRFVGLGVTLSRAELPAASPFLDARWALAAARLPRARKLGGAWHRAAIARFAPELLRHPSGGAPAPATLRGAWLRRRPPAAGYSPFARVLEDPDVQERIRRSPRLERFAPEAERDAMVDARDRRAMELMLTLDAAACAARAATQPAAIMTTPPRAATTPAA